MSFWDRLDAELAECPARPVFERDLAMSTERFTCYRVRFTGLDSYRLFGYLSVPAGRGPFPALLETPRHGSVNHPPHYNDRLRYVMLTVMHRGQRLADVPFAAAYPGLFACGVTDPDGYVYRSIIADCLRGAELLFDQPDADPVRFAVTGDDLALFTAARRSGFRAARVTEPLLHDVMRRRTGTETYPLEELNDHLRHHPEQADALEETFARYEPATLAADIGAEVLLAEPVEGTAWNGALLGALGERATVYRRTGEDALDADELDAWLAERLGVPARSRFTG